MCRSWILLSQSAVSEPVMWSRLAQRGSVGEDGEGAEERDLSPLHAAKRTREQ